MILDRSISHNNSHVVLRVRATLGPRIQLYPVPMATLCTRTRRVLPLEISTATCERCSVLSACRTAEQSFLRDNEYSEHSAQ